MSIARKAGFLSIVVIFLWALLNVSLRYLVLEYNCHPVALACSNALFCALALIAFGSRKVDVAHIIYTPHTWIFGTSQLLKNICMIYAFTYISSTEANLLTNIEIVFSVLLAWFIRQRRPNFIDAVSMVLIFLGCMILVAGLPAGVMLLATFWVFCGSFLTSLRTVAAEVHPDNKKELQPRVRSAVTGYIMLLSSIVLALVFISLSLAASASPSSIVEHSALLQSLPSPSQFVSIPNILGGFILGTLVYSVSMYCYFYAVGISTSEYFMMFRSAQAVFTYAVEIVFAAFTALPMVKLSMTDWFAAATIIFCSMSMILMRSKRGKAFRRILNKA